jgi:hypothetical protein
MAVLASISGTFFWIFGFFEGERSKGVGSQDTCRDGSRNTIKQKCIQKKEIIIKG